MFLLYLKMLNSSIFLKKKNSKFRSALYSKWMLKLAKYLINKLLTNCIILELPIFDFQS